MRPGPSCLSRKVRETWKQTGKHNGTAEAERQELGPQFGVPSPSLDVLVRDPAQRKVMGRWCSVWQVKCTDPLCRGEITELLSPRTLYLWDLM